MDPAATPRSARARSIRRRAAGMAVGLLALALLAGASGAPIASAAPPPVPVVGPSAPVATAAVEAAEDGPVDVIVSYDPDHDSAIDKRQALARAGDDASLVRDFEHLPAQVVRVDSEEALTALAADPDVSGIELPTTYKPVAAPWLEMIEQPAAVATGQTGVGTTVAVLDTGLDYTLPAGGLFGNCAGGHGSTGCRVISFETVYPGGALDPDPEKHGTNVGGIVASVAPGTRLAVYGVFFDTPDGLATSTEVVLAALDDVVDKAPGSGVRAVNLSFAEPGSFHVSTCSSPFTSVFAELRSMGILPVVASGNEAYLGSTFHNGVANPACAAGALSVGAVYHTDAAFPIAWGLPGQGCVDLDADAYEIPCFSQTGPLLDVLAPGVLITAAGTSLSGTSQAAPHVAGAAAVLFGSNPVATTTKIEAALTGNGTQITDTRSTPATTRRLLDMEAALAEVAPTPAVVPRISGEDRIATAIATSKSSYPSADSADAVVLASSATFPDGLAGTPLAAHHNAPMLLTNQASLRSDVLAEVQRVLPGGGTVYVLGGTVALSDAVPAALANAGFLTQRLAGADRYATAVQIAEALPTPVGVLLATGLNFPDALSAGVAAAHFGGAVLFTNGTTMAPATGAWLSAHPSVPVAIVGGTAAGSHPTPTTLAGADRYATAVLVANQYFGSTTHAAVASGTVFADALSGGAHIAKRGGPILLSPPAGLSSVVRSWFRARADQLTTVYIYGGTTALSAAVRDQIVADTS